MGMTAVGHYPYPVYGKGYGNLNPSNFYDNLVHFPHPYLTLNRVSVPVSVTRSVPGCYTL